MAKQIIKTCKKCLQECYHEYSVDNEIADEPIFWLTCEACGFSEQAEQWI